MIPTCLACLQAEIKPHLVLCRACYAEHKDVVKEVEADPIGREKLRQVLWGQRFAKNRTPKARARIAMAAYLLAQSGDDEMLQEVRRVFPTYRQAVDVVPEPATAPESNALATEAAAVNALEAALDRRPPRAVDSPGTFRTSDGHWVRSKSERDIANFLFLHRIWYQYERQVTIADVPLRPDFYLPDVGPQGTFLEHFGKLDDPGYRELAQRKAELFRKAKLPLIATSEDDAADFENRLHGKLTKAGATLRVH